MHYLREELWAPSCLNFSASAKGSHTCFWWHPANSAHISCQNWVWIVETFVTSKGLIYDKQSDIEKRCSLHCVIKITGTCSLDFARWTCLTSYNCSFEELPYMRPARNELLHKHLQAVRVLWDREKVFLDNSVDMTAMKDHASIWTQLVLARWQHQLLYKDSPQYQFCYFLPRCLKFWIISNSESFSICELRFSRKLF